ncbi:MAG: hypothetical protein JWR26_4075 [Pedosphaera sp.]|nr:hypothetical protein [Pedosphaera sp.]
MIPAPTYLRNNEAVIKAFGYWPSFHDAPVLDFRYSKEAGGEAAFTLHGWKMTGVVDDRGYHEMSKHHLVRFSFRDISDEDLSSFIPENILFDLGFSGQEEFAAAGKFKVDLNSAMGSDVGGSFFARTGEVLDVALCDEKGKRV